MNGWYTINVPKQPPHKAHTHYVRTSYISQALSDWCPRMAQWSTSRMLHKNNVKTHTQTHTQANRHIVPGNRCSSWSGTPKPKSSSFAPLSRLAPASPKPTAPVGELLGDNRLGERTEVSEPSPIVKIRAASSYIYTIFGGREGAGG